MTVESITKARQVFVAYPYGIYPKTDYRKVFEELADEYQVSFVFADEKITNMHILEKIRSYILASEFSVYDISNWNPNVTLELGLAIGLQTDWYIAYNPDKIDMNEVPSDLRGIDRIQYASYSEYKEKLGALLEQRFPRRQEGIEQYLEEVRDKAREALEAEPGLKMSELAELLGVGAGVVSLAIKPLVGRELETTGRTRGTRYWPKGTKPNR